MRQLIQHLLRFTQTPLKTKASRGLIYLYEPGEDGIVRAPTSIFRITEEGVELCYEHADGLMARKP